ncbi:hypothetical protein ACFC4C_22975 [Streptomyces sp. NPDC056039]|uniref:hypothetical protein n=1 Tax=Streptomyces sp. NPDC056039 TaxID=3345687 RepID=UPI0035E2A62D
MSTWLIIAEETGTADGAASHRQIKVIRTVNGNKTREQALVELHNVAKSHVPDSLKSTSTVVGQSQSSMGVPVVVWPVAYRSRTSWPTPDSST